MSGDRRYLLDTNAVVSLLSSNRNLSNLLEDADWVGISIVSFLEFLAFDGLSPEDKDCFLRFCDRVEVVHLSRESSGLVESAIDLRVRYGLKLPDAVIGATAMDRDAVLVTDDVDFRKVGVLRILPNP